MRGREGILRWTVRLAFMALAVGVGLSFRQSLDLGADLAGKGAAKSKKGEDELCAGLVLARRSGGGECLSVGRVSTRRLRRGPFSFGVREMVVDWLVLTLPESYFRPPEPKPDPAPGAAGSPPSAVRPSAPSVLDVLEDDGRMKEMFPQVAGLTVCGLMIDRLEGGTNAVHWLRAEQASVRKGGLALQKGASIENGVTNVWKRAFLELKPCLRLHH